MKKYIAHGILFWNKSYSLFLLNTSSWLSFLFNFFFLAYNISKWCGKYPDHQVGVTVLLLSFAHFLKEVFVCNEISTYGKGGGAGKHGKSTGWIIKCWLLKIMSVIEGFTTLILALTHKTYVHKICFIGFFNRVGNFKCTIK